VDFFELFIERSKRYWQPTGSELPQVSGIATRGKSLIYRTPAMTPATPPLFFHKLLCILQRKPFAFFNLFRWQLL